MLQRAPRFTENTKKTQDSTYLVTVDVEKIGELEYVVDMDIGVCSCSKGFYGAGCKHQATVAKVFNVCTVNLAPYYSKEARKIFADLALGEKSMATEFYADQQSPTHAISSALAENTDNSENGAYHENDCSSLEPTSDNMDCDGRDPLEEQIENFHASLREIDDIANNESERGRPQLYIWLL